MIKKGSTELSKFYLGNTEASAIYLGEDLIWPTEVPFTTYDLTFLTNTNLVNTSQVFTTLGGGFGNTGLETVYTLAGDKNGRVYMKFHDAASWQFALGLNAANAQSGYLNMEAGLYFGGDNNLYKIDATGGTFVASGTTITVGRWYAVLKIASNYKLQYSTDEINWIDIGGFRRDMRYNDSAAVYIVCDGYAAGAAKMYHPTLMEYGTGNLGKLFIQDGNSLGVGYDGTANILNNLGFQVRAAIGTNNDFMYSNLAVSGQSIANISSRLASYVYPIFGTAGNSYCQIIYAVIEGTNSIHGGLTGAQAYTGMMAVVNAVLAQDSRTCVMVYGMPNCDPAYASEAERLAYNTALYATPETSRFVWVAVPAALDTATSYLNGTYYAADGIHLKEAGQTLQATAGAAKALTF